MVEAESGYTPQSLLVLHLRHMLVLGLVAAASTAAPSAIALERAEECASHAEHGLELQDKGRPVTALEDFKICAAQTCPKIVRDDCRNAIVEIRKTAPRLFVRLRDPAGSDIVDAVIDVDGRPVTSEERAVGFSVDTGVHVIRASTKTAAEIEKSVLVAATDRERIVEMVLTPRTTAPPPSTSPDRTTKPDRTLAFIAGGIGLGLVAAGGVVGASSYAKYNDLDSRCGGSCSASEVRPLKTQIFVTDVLLATGVVSLVVATVLWISAPERSR